MARLKVIADTGPLVSASDRSDPAHAVASHLVTALRADLLVPDPVVGEVDYLLRSKGTPAMARAFLEDLRLTGLRRVALDQRLFSRAVVYDRTFADLDLGIADGSIMALAEAERAAILTFDFRDFRATRPLGGGTWRLAIDEEMLRRALES